MIRLDKLLSNLGYASRREVKKLIAQGVVTSRTLQSLQSDVKVDPATILFNGEPIDSPDPLLILLNKPRGYVCSRDDQGLLVYELLPERYRRRTPVVSIAGRLDKDSQGLLLLTDDGDLLHRLTHPHAHVPKEYIVETKYTFRGDEKDLFESGEFSIEPNEKLLPVEFFSVTTTTARLILHEGKNRQIRRMFDKLGNEVIMLKRIRVGGVSLPEDLPEGSWKFIDRKLLIGS